MITFLRLNSISATLTILFFIQAEFLLHSLWLNALLG